MKLRKTYGIIATSGPIYDEFGWGDNDTQNLHISDEFRPISAWNQPDDTESGNAENWLAKRICEELKIEQMEAESCEEP